MKVTFPLIITHFKEARKNVGGKPHKNEAALKIKQYGTYLAIRQTFSPSPIIQV